MEKITKKFITDIKFGRVNSLTPGYTELREKALAYMHTLNAIPLQMIIDLDENGAGCIEEVSKYSKGNEPDTLFPMWGYVWQFNEDFDDYWLSDKGGIKEMTKIGFRVYDSEYGYFFGIDSAGHDFVDAYWIPLYYERFLKEN